VLLAIKQMGGESTEAWRTVLDDLVRRGLQRPELLIVDGGAGLESAIAAVWDSVPVQRCTVHYADFRIMPRQCTSPLQMGLSRGAPYRHNPSGSWMGK
jgi:transposase-like protein